MDIETQVRGSKSLSESLLADQDQCPLLNEIQWYNNKIFKWKIVNQITNWKPFYFYCQQITHLRRTRNWPRFTFRFCPTKKFSICSTSTNETFKFSDTTFNSEISPSVRKFLNKEFLNSFIVFYLEIIFKTRFKERKCNKNSLMLQK